MAAGDDGTLAIAWSYQGPAGNVNTQNQIQVAVRPAGSTQWTVSTLAQGPLGGVSLVSMVPVAVDKSGNVTAAWMIWDGTTNIVQAAAKPAGGTWSSPVTLSTAGDTAFAPSMAVNAANGDAGVAFVVSPYRGSYMPAYAQYVFRAGQAGTWSAPLTVSEVIPASTGYVQNPIAGLDASSRATVAYLGYGMEAVRQTQAGWTTPKTVIPAPNPVSSLLSPDLAVDSNGNAVAVVSIFDATINVDRASVWVTRGSANGSWSAPLRITNPAAPVDAYATRAMFAGRPAGGGGVGGSLSRRRAGVAVDRLGMGRSDEHRQVDHSLVVSEMPVLACRSE